MIRVTSEEQQQGTRPVSYSGLASKYDTNAKPDVRTAQKYLEEQLPHRIDEHQAQQGFRRNRPGELVDSHGDKAELYPLCTSDVYEDLDGFGLGIGLYFRQVLFFLIIMIVASIILIASISHNAEECKHSETGGNEKNDGLAQGSAAGCFPEDLSVAWNVVPDVLVCFVILVCTFSANKLEHIIECRIDESQQTASDYSLYVSNPPKDVDDPDKYKEFFENFFLEGPHEDIVAVTVSKDNGKFMQLLAERRGYLRDLEDFQACERRGDQPRFDELPWCAKVLQPYTYSYGVFKTKKFAREQLENVETAIGELIQGGSEAWREPRRVIVTFASEDAQRRALEAYDVSALRRWIANATGIESQETPKAFGGTVLSVSKPVEPSEILWHNSHVPGYERFARLCCSVLVVGAALVVVVLVTNALKTEWKFTLSIFITAVNAVLPPFIKVVTTTVERHVDFGDVQDSMYIKLLSARWVNTALAVFISYGPRNRLSNDALSQVMLILLFDAFLGPLIRIFDPYDLFLRRLVSPLQPTQRAMNRFWIGAEWNIAERYTDVAKTVFVGMFYAAALPTAPIVTAAAMLTTFCADRFCLLRKWRRVPELDAQLAKRTIGLIALVVFLHFWASLAFFLNWGSYGSLREDDGVDDRVFHKVNCFDGLLRCKVQGKNLTSAQRFVYRVYSPLGFIAFAAALWKFAGVEVQRFFCFLFVGSSSQDKVDTIPIPFRECKNIDLYVPVISHRGLPENLIAANLVDVPNAHLPIAPGSDVDKLKLATLDEIRPLLTSEHSSDAAIQAIVDAMFGVVKYYPPPVQNEPPPPYDANQQVAV